MCRTKMESFSLNTISSYRAELMGIAILWVMLFHSDIQCPESIIPKIFWYIFVSFGGGLGVDLFFLLSGYGLVFSHKRLSCCDGSKAYFGFLRRRVARIAFPYFVVATIRYVVRDIITDHSLDIIRLIKRLFFYSYFFEGYDTYWFIPAILVCYVLFPFYIYTVEKRDSLKFTTGITIIWCVLFFLIDTVICKNAPVQYAHFEILILRIPSFLLGAFIGVLSHAHKKTKGTYILLLSGILLLISLGFYAIIFHQMTIRMERYIYILISFCLFFWIPFILSLFKTKSRIFVITGGLSLQLYLIHLPVFSVIGHANDSIPDILALIIGIFISFILAVLLKKIEDCFKRNRIIR